MLVNNDLSLIVNKMPILGFEKHQYRKKLREAIGPKPNLLSDDETMLLIAGYFADQEFPLHCRRTLDQFTYHMLKDTNKRDNTQVMFKWVEKQNQPRRRRQGRKIQDPQSRAKDDYPILMVDRMSNSCCLFLFSGYSGSRTCSRDSNFVPE